MNWKCLRALHHNLLQSYYQASTLVENTEEDVLKQQVEGTDARNGFSSRHWTKPNAIWQHAASLTSIKLSFNIG